MYMHLVYAFCRTMQTTRTFLVYHFGWCAPLRRSEAMIQELEVPEPGSEPLHFPTEYAVGRLGQLKTIVWKFACVYWRYSGAHEDLIWLKCDCQH